VTGHADTVGAHGYNLALSRDRARAVRAALMARGVPASQIVVRAKGETAPAIDTGDEVREPRNRRVVIALE
jgi:outer membrane protein OmpA-like peptidoglycan-associated protein